MDVSNDNFGIVIAYVIPGATAIAGLSSFSPTLEGWLNLASESGPTVGGFLYLTLAALGMGMAVSAVRWLLIDRLIGLTGVIQPTADFSRLMHNVDAFGLLIESHYRHYLFYANMTVAIGVAFVSYRVRTGSLFHISWLDMGFVAIELVFLAASRDTLRKYYIRSKQLLSAPKGRH